MTPDTQVSDNRPATRVAAILKQAGSVAGALAATEERVRQHPRAFEARWELFQWLCVIADWPRALKQLQVATQLAPDFGQTALVYRDLIRSEVFRCDVFAGKRKPGNLLASPAWLDDLLLALQHNGEASTEAADHYRNQAFERVPDVAGSIDGHAIAWITDSDTRLGPACEIIAAGQYAWLPFCQMRSLRVQAATGLLDVVWTAVAAVLADGSTVRGFVPTRYPGSERGVDSIRLARTTVWQDHGLTGVFALGQKTWTTDTGDTGLLDLRDCIVAPCHV